VSTDRKALVASLAVVSALVAVVALAVAIVALRKHSSDSARIRTLQSQARAASAPVSNVRSAIDQANAKLTAAEGQISALETKLSKLTSQVSEDAGCLPEVQAEINGLELKEAGTTFYIANGTHTSVSCSRVLFPPTGG
jgi:peptidoglycan hydrolase CwlO-like protein